jgi:hypothetical protein
MANKVVNRSQRLASILKSSSFGGGSVTANVRRPDHLVFPHAD